MNLWNRLHPDAQRPAHRPVADPPPPAPEPRPVWVKRMNTGQQIPKGVAPA